MSRELRSLPIVANLRAKKSDTVYFFSFLLEVLRNFIGLYRNRNIGKLVLVRQILYTGYESLGIISLIALAIGAIIIIEGNAIFAGFGQSKMFYTILISVVSRELSCLLTAFIIIARSGTAISTELGNMVVNHEIDALVSFGISPITYLVVPRVFGVVVSLVTLTIYFNAVAVLGTWVISSVMYNIGLYDFLLSVITEMTTADILSSFLKSVFFGFAIALVSSYEGLCVHMASTEVPQRTIKAVVRSLTVVIILDILITAIFYF